MLKRLIVCLFAIFMLAGLSRWREPAAAGQSRRKPERSAVVRLGERLFRDDRFSTPNGDLPASCSNCHLLDEDPQGLRAYADFFNRSWISSRLQDRRRLELRNSPTIFDVAGMSRLHYDGEFASLEDLVKGTLSGRPMGWLPGEESQAFDRARAVLLADKGAGAYREQFKQALNVEIDKLGPDELIDLVAKAVAEFMRTLNTRQDSPYDVFVQLNGLPRRTAPGEGAKAFAGRLLASVNSLEARGALKFARGLDAEALRGLKIFFTTEGANSVGNCVACHAPPSFTDNLFHNLGVSPREYDAVHGEGKFAELPIPNAATARRPAPQFREIPAKDKPGAADLGFWNFVKLKHWSQRRAGESDDRFLQRMIAAFKTPTLRNLNYSYPYLHDGSLHTTEAVVNELMQLSRMARAGQVRAADEELPAIRLAAPDVAPLVAFLHSLNEDLKRGY